MMNEKLKNKRIEEVASYLTQFMKFSKEEIAKAIYIYEITIDAIEDIDTIDMGYVKSGLVYVYEDAIIFTKNNGAMQGIDVKRKLYLSDDDCVDLLDPDFYYVGDHVRWVSSNDKIKNVGEV